MKHNGSAKIWVIVLALVLVGAGAAVYLKAPLKTMEVNNVDSKKLGDDSAGSGKRYSFSEPTSVIEDINLLDALHLTNSCEIWIDGGSRQVLGHVEYGDVDGDLRKDIVIVHTSSCGTAGDYFLGAYKLKDSSTLEEVVSSKNVPYKQVKWSWKKKILIVGSPDYVGDDANCCPSFYKIAGYRWNSMNGAFEIVGGEQRIDSRDRNVSFWDWDLNRYFD